MENKPINEIKNTCDYIGSSVEPNEGDSLSHFNPNHDALGRFTSGIGGRISSISSKVSKNSSKKTNSSKKSKSVKKTKPKSKVTKLKKKSRKTKQTESKEQKIANLQTARRRSEEKKKILNSGDAKRIYENRDSFTTQQINDAIYRMNTEATLKSIVAKQNPTKTEKLKRTVGKVVTPENLKRTADLIENASNLYNQSARIANTFRDEDHQLKYIGKAENKSPKMSKAVQDIVFSGDATKILANQSKLTNEQVRDAKQRLDNLANINKQAEQARKIQNDRRQTLMSEANSAVNKYGEDYAKSVLSRNYGNEIANYYVTEAVTKQKLNELDTQAANRYISSSNYKNKMDENKRMGVKYKKSDVWHGNMDLGVNELCHYGVLGMKWGVRRYQSYDTVPRKSGKGGKEVGNAVKSKLSVNTGMARYPSTGQYPTELGDPMDSWYVETAFDSDAFDRKWRNPTSIDLDDSKPVAEMISDSLKNGTKNPFPRETGWDGLVDSINPDYGTPGTTNNCPFCTCAMEIASRGYDVVARKASGGTNYGVFERWFKDAETTGYGPAMDATIDEQNSYNAFSELKEDIIKYGDGASGALNIFYTPLSGHCIHWRNDKGNVVIEDGQTHESCSIEEIPDKYGVMKDTCLSTRLDNCEPNWDELAKDGALGTSNKRNRRWETPTGLAYTYNDMGLDRYFNRI